MFESLSNNAKVIPGTTTTNTQLVANTGLPASGAFIDTRGSVWVNVILRWGAINAGDTPVIEPQCANAINGTPTQISPTLQHTAVNTDDNKYVSWWIRTQDLGEKYFLTLMPLSGVVNGTFADVTFTLHQLNVATTQDQNVLPNEAQYVYGGQQFYQPS